ncbi:TonB-dependent siderophore receptor [Bergeyella sp. RCAD1439]|uniref:TonB-dependent siderophore receptor n=1 Tax=Bergeyella anatis TaxID=3113737 RepID=UPI002E171091|nr:TonB-dependent siderophore receptor [Bergeyella sp. RCAD1439]
MKRLGAGAFFWLAYGLVSAQMSYQPNVTDLDTLRHTRRIDEVQLFGESKKHQEGLEVITRMPLKTRDQIQSISVISYKVIEDLGGLTVTDVAKNVPGVTLFASYGGVRESMSIRGFRGVPVLKNGVLMDSDFRTGSMLTDMQGVESIQVIKGSAAVTQGIGTGLGSAGGVINVVTKSPQFRDETKVGFRYGSWDFYRPTLDFQRVLDREGRVAVRFNAAYQDSNSFRAHVYNDRVYVNPSVAFLPDDRTKIVVEMDYLKHKGVPDRGTVNLSEGDVEALYHMPKGKFLGYSTDYVHTESFNFSTTAERKLNDKFKIRTAYFNSSAQRESVGANIGRGEAATGYAVRSRTLAKSGVLDRNQVFQFDFVGQEVYTGKIKHTFQVGFDWRMADTDTDTYALANGVVFRDRINVLETISNDLPSGLSNAIFDLSRRVNAKAMYSGLMAQDVITFNKYFKGTFGLRYSRELGKGSQYAEAWNPSLGLMFSPRENMNLFGSYTTTTDLRSAANPLYGGGTVGASRTDQVEVGLKSDWLDEKLRFNVTLFHINTGNLSYSVLNSDGTATGEFGLAGDLRRRGAEVELIGRVLPNLQVMAGYAYLDAQYRDSPAFVNGSAPMNTPEHTANAWVNYKFREGFLRCLDLGLGAYYVGARPVDNYSQKTIITAHVNSVTPGMKPFDMKAYTTVEAQVGYTLGNWGLRVFFGNIFDAVGYSSYFRGGYIDQIQPRNFSGQITYRF